MRSLYDICYLATYLWALDRKAEAMEIVSDIAKNVPEPPPYNGGFNYNIWCPAALSHALLVHLQKPATKLSKFSLETILRDVGISRTNKDYPQSKLDTANKLVNDPPILKPRKLDHERFASSLSFMLVFSILGNGGVTFFEPYAKQAEENIPPLLDKLGAMLKLVQ